MTVQTFILGKEKIPSWFDEEASKGRARINYDDEGKIVNATLLSGSKTYTANVGDSIMNTKSGMVALSKEKAKQYGVQKKDTKEEEKSTIEEKD